MPRVIIVHGWDGYPEEGWFPWLKSELEAKGFAVQVPAMPNPSEPKIETWVPYLSEIVGAPDENTILVGHSIGCQTIIRYLETLPENIKIGGALFVAGWFRLKNLENEEAEKIAEPWLNTPIDFEKVKNAIGRLNVILSENDPYNCVEENAKMFKEKLNAHGVFVEEDADHFTGAEYPRILTDLLDVLGVFQSLPK